MVLRLCEGGAAVVAGPVDAVDGGLAVQALWTVGDPSTARQHPSGPKSVGGGLSVHRLRSGCLFDI